MTGKTFEYRAFPTFSEQFNWHLENGTRPGGTSDKPGKLLTSADFARAMGRNNDDRAFIEKLARAIGNWRKRTHPKAAAEERILATLFGTTTPRDTEFARWKTRLHELWLAQEKAKSAAKPKATPAPDDAHLRTNTTWVPDDPWTVWEGLAKLWVHPPEPDREANRFDLEVTVSFGDTIIPIPATADSPRVDLLVTPTKAELVLVTENRVQPVKGTILGLDIVRPNLRYGASWRIDVVRDAGGYPISPLNGEVLCKMHILDATVGTVALELRCRDYELDVVPREAPPGTNAKQLNVLSRLMQVLLPREDADSATLPLARGRLRRNAQP
jgi:hypothetical protein